MPSISLCMIVKNEEEMLPRALGNLNGFADELIIVDTGSTDATVAIAHEFDATVLHYDWQQPGHKGEGRNLGIDSARGDWIVVLDADEIITEPAILRRQLLSSQADALRIEFQNVNESDQVTLIWRQIRCFRRGKYRYCYREHEIPVAIDARIQQDATGCIIEHRPPPSRYDGKLDTMLQRLDLDVQEHPTDTHPRYFYARQLLLNGKVEDAITHYMTYLDLADPNLQDVSEAYGDLGTCYMALGDHAESLRWLYKALIIHPKWKSWWIKIAQVYLHLNETNLAQSILQCADSLWSEQLESNHEPMYYNGYIAQLTAECHGRIAESWRHHGVRKFAHGPHK